VVQATTAVDDLHRPLTEHPQKHSGPDTSPLLGKFCSVEIQASLDFHGHGMS
jgi:hypothetical protein